MKIRESITIAADPVEVWPFIADPALQQKWNPKIESIKRHNTGLLKYGERYQMSYTLSGKTTEIQVEVTEMDPPRNLTLEHTSFWKGQEQRAVIYFQVSYDDAGTKIEQTIDMRLTGVPIWLRIIAWLAGKFGKPTDTTYLQEMKRLIEEKSAGKKS